MDRLKDAKEIDRYKNNYGETDLFRDWVVGYLKIFSKFIDKNEK